MVETSVLEKMINFIYGALIFVILVGILFAVYHIFWAEEPSVPEQNFESVFAELNLLKRDSCLDVVIRPHNVLYTLYLRPWDNSAPLCNKMPCLCLQETDGPEKCLLVPDVNRDTGKGRSVVKDYFITINIGDNRPVAVCNRGNNLSIVY